MPRITSSIEICDQYTNQCIPALKFQILKSLNIRQWTIADFYSFDRVHLGNLADFVTTSCITKLSFLRDPSHGMYQLTLLKRLYWVNKQVTRKYSETCLFQHALERNLRSEQTGCQITQCKTHRKWSKGNENSCRITHCQEN